jgi:NitT/TauT family transport system permease protein
MGNSTTFLYLKKISTKIAVILFWLAIWQAIYLLVQKDILIPRPLDVFLRLGELVLTKSFWLSVFHTLMRVFMGVCLSLLAGTMLGIFSGLNKFCDELLNPLMVAIKATPIMSFIIIAIVWFGSQNVPIFICFLIAFPIIWTNIREGTINVDPKLLEMAFVYRVSKYKIFKNIYMPELKPYFFSGLVTIIGLGWKATVTAEVLSLPLHAVGGKLHDARVIVNSVDVFAITIAIIVISMIIEAVVAHCLIGTGGRRIHSAN